MPLNASENGILVVERKCGKETVLRQLRCLNNYGSQSFTDTPIHPRDECSQANSTSEAHPSAPQKPVSVPIPQQSSSILAVLRRQYTSASGFSASHRHQSCPGICHRIISSVPVVLF